MGLVPNDFSRKAVGDAMSAAGFRRDLRTFFILEGVTEYLAADVTEAILDFIAGAAGRGSWLAFTYIHRGVLEGTHRFPGARRLLAHSQRGRERFSSGFDPAGLETYLRERGLQLVEDVAGAEFEARYFKPLGRGLRASDFQRTALARISGRSEAAADGRG